MCGFFKVHPTYVPCLPGRMDMCFYVIIYFLDYPCIILEWNVTHGNNISLYPNSKG